MEGRIYSRLGSKVTKQYPQQAIHSGEGKKKKDQNLDCPFVVDLQVIGWTKMLDKFCHADEHEAERRSTAEEKQQAGQNGEQGEAINREDQEQHQDQPTA